MNAIHKTSLINGIAAEYININDRALHYGDGLFETVLCSDSSLYFWQQHYQRLQSAARRLNIECPDEAILLQDIRQLFCQEEIPATAAYVLKIILSRGSGERGYGYPKDISATRIVMLSELDSAYSSLLAQQLLTGDLYICNNQVSINQGLAGLKHLNRLENVLARNEWHDTKQHRYIDGLMSNAYHHIIEGTMSNIFAVKHGQLFTPGLEMCGINGIMRDVVIELASDLGIMMTMKDVTLDELLAMDELFITNSLIGLKSVNRLGDTQYRSAQITKLVFDKLLSIKQHHAQEI